MYGSILQKLRRAKYTSAKDLQYPIPDKQVFFEVEDPLSNGQLVNFPTSKYIFVNALAPNSPVTFMTGLPLYNGVEFVMKPPCVKAYVASTFGMESNYMGTQEFTITYE